MKFFKSHSYFREASLNDSQKTWISIFSSANKENFTQCVTRRVKEQNKRKQQKELAEKRNAQTKENGQNRKHVQLKGRMKEVRWASETNDEKERKRVSRASETNFPNLLVEQATRVFFWRKAPLRTWNRTGNIYYNLQRRTRESIWTVTIKRRLCPHSVLYCLTRNSSCM